MRRLILLERRYGKGRIIYCAYPIEHEKYVTYRRIIRALIDEYVGLDSLTVRSNAPTNVEVITFRDWKDLLICSCLLLDPASGPFIPPYEFRVKTEARPRAVRLLPEEEDTEFTFEDG